MAKLFIIKCLWSDLTRILMHACTYTHMHTYVCMYVCMLANTVTESFHGYIDECTRPDRDSRSCMHTEKWRQVHIYTRMHEPLLSCMHARMHVPPPHTHTQMKHLNSCL